MIAHTSDTDIERFAPWWRQHALADFGPFGRPEWAQIYRQVFSSEADLLLLEQTGDTGETTALIPLERAADRTLRFIGGTEVTDYAAPIAAEACLPAIAELFAGWLDSNPDEWDSVSLEAMPVDIRFGAALETAAASVGLKVERVSNEVCAVLDLPATFDEYLDGLEKKERHEFRRKWGKFNRELGEASLVRANAETIDADIALFFKWHREARGAKGEFMGAAMEEFFTELARTSLELGWLRLEFVEAAGTRVAASFAFCDGERYYLYNSAFRQDARPHSPGMALLWLVLEESFATGVTSVDFLQGDERYKFKLGSRARQLEAVRIVR